MTGHEKQGLEQNKKNRRRKKRKYNKIVDVARTGVFLLMLFLLLRGVLSFTEWFQSIEAEKSSLVSVERSAEGEGKERVVLVNENTALQEEGDSGQAENSLSDGERQEAQRIYQNNRELLVLVNKEIELSQEYDPLLRKICKGRLRASSRLYSDLTMMLEDGKRAGYQFWIASAYRSRQRQQELVNEDVRKYIRQGMGEEEALAKTLEETMPAGHSEHETGLALDILSSDNLNMDSSQETSGANVWLRQHCHEYGFILRYPKEAEAITGIAYEPWHFRYVGREAAAFITEHGITLEEFCEAAGAS